MEELARRRVVGVDFSGAHDAGRRVWIAEARPDAGRRLHVTACRPAAALPGGGRARAGALAALRGFVARPGPVVVGLDFPFSVARRLIRERRWRDWIRAFAARFPTAEAFRAAGLARAGGAEARTRRRTDLAARVPWAPVNLRLYRQTYFGIRDVLGPLVAARRVAVLPFERPRASVPWLLEVCPASALKRRDLYRPYKGAGTARARQRATILAALADDGVSLAPAVGAAARGDAAGDALDSVVAAVAAWDAVRDPARLAAVARAADPLEGWVYR
jgi:hypothetical protein